MSTSGQRAKVDPARPPSLGGEFRARTQWSNEAEISTTPGTAAETLVRFDFYGDESGNEAVATKKGSYEMQGDAVEMQIGDPNAV